MQISSSSSLWSDWLENITQQSGSSLAQSSKNREADGMSISGLTEALEGADTDGNGSISKSEFKELLAQASESAESSSDGSDVYSAATSEMADDLFALIDENADDEISTDEISSFKNNMLRQLEQMGGGGAVRPAGGGPPPAMEVSETEDDEDDDDDIMSQYLADLIESVYAAKEDDESEQSIEINAVRDMVSQMLQSAYNQGDMASSGGGAAAGGGMVA